MTDIMGYWCAVRVVGAGVSRYWQVNPRLLLAFHHGLYQLASIQMAGGDDRITETLLRGFRCVKGAEAGFSRVAGTPFGAGCLLLGAASLAALKDRGTRVRTYLRTNDGEIVSLLGSEEPMLHL